MLLFILVVNSLVKCVRVCVCCLATIFQSIIQRYFYAKCSYSCFVFLDHWIQKSVRYVPIDCGYKCISAYYLNPCKFVEYIVIGMIVNHM